MPDANRIWAVTTYFNPYRYARRRANYDLFCAALRLPLLTVELSFADEPASLTPADADLLLPLRGADVLWQKERLLNLALPHLPDTCTGVLCVDCDVIFDAPDLANLIFEGLGHAPLLQPFSRLHHLAPNALPHAAPPLFSQPSLASVLARERDPTAPFSRILARSTDSPSPGMAWAARRDLLATHGLYDACIVGGGDTALACAAYGCFDQVIHLHAMNPAQQARYLAWARPFHAAVQANVGALDLDLHHLYHGTIAARQPRQRHLDLAPFHYDPARDLTPDSVSGAWRWTDPANPLKAHVARYFHSRNEDA